VSDSCPALSTRQMTGCSLKNQSRVKSSHTTILYYTHDVHTKGAYSLGKVGTTRQIKRGAQKHTPSITPLPTLWIPSLTTHCALKEQLSVQTTSQGIHMDDSTKPPGDPVEEDQRHRQSITCRPSSSSYYGPFHLVPKTSVRTTA